MHLNCLSNREENDAMISEKNRDLPHIACVIIAGGRSKRFGTNKALATLNGERLVDIIITRLKAQTSGPIAVNTREEMKPLTDGLTVVTDVLTGDIGPLAGLHSAMTWARDSGHETVITTPVDTPVLPDNYIAKLIESKPPSIASYDDRFQPLHGIWCSSHAKLLGQEIGSGMRAARRWAECCDAKQCEFAVDKSARHFANINRPEDLLKLR